MMDAPSSACRTMESLALRMASGSRPVRGSSKRITFGRWMKAQAMESFCFMPRLRAPGSSPAFPASSNSSRRRGIRCSASSTR